MNIQEQINLGKEAKIIAKETGRNFREVLAEITPERKAAKKMDFSKIKGTPISAKQLKELEIRKAAKKEWDRLAPWEQAVRIEENRIEEIYSQGINL